MSRKVLADLSLRLSANSAELRRGLEESRREMRRLNTSTQTIGRQMTMAFGKVAAAIAVARQGLRTIDGIIQSTATTADNFRRVSDGLSAAWGSFARSIATGNFNSFVTNMQNATRAAQAYSDAMDEIAKRQLALELGDVQTANEVFRLDQIIYDDSRSDDEKLKALVDKEEIIREQSDRNIRVAQEGIDELRDRINREFRAVFSGYDRGEWQDSDMIWRFFTEYDDDAWQQVRRDGAEYLQLVRRLQNSTQQLAALEATPNFERQQISGFDQQLNRARQNVEDLRQGIKRVNGEIEEGSKLDWFIQDESQELINLITPDMGDIIGAERALEQARGNLERSMASLTRERRRIHREIGVDVEVDVKMDGGDVSGEGLFDSPSFSDFLDVERQVAIGIAIDQGDYENSLVTIEALRDKLNQLESTRLTLEPDDEGYAAINQQIADIQGEISRRGGLGIGDNIDEVAQAMGEYETRLQSIVSYNEVLGDSFDLTAEKISLLESTIRSLIDAGVDLEGELLGSLTEYMNTLKASVEETNESIQEQTDSFVDWQNVGAQAASQIGMAMMDMAGDTQQSVSDILRSLLRMIVGQLIAQIVSSVPFPANIALAAGAGAMAGGLFSQIPALADGGIAYGETIARVGEYPGAQANPEVIAPLDKLKGIMGESRAGSLDGEVRFVIEEDMLVGILNKHSNKLNNF